MALRDVVHRLILGHVDSYKNGPFDPSRPLNLLIENLDLKSPKVKKLLELSLKLKT